MSDLAAIVAREPEVRRLRTLASESGPEEWDVQIEAPATETCERVIRAVHALAALDTEIRSTAADLAAMSDDEFEQHEQDTGMESQVLAALDTEVPA